MIQPAALADAYLPTRPETPELAPVLVRAADVVPVKVQWYWPHRIPLGRPTSVEGDPGTGKSTLCLDLAARGSRGEPFPDGAPCEAGGVVICSAEDGAADTIVPRLTAAGADLDRIVLLTGVVGERGREPLTFPDHADALRAAVQAVDARLVIVDPLAAYQTGAVDSWKDADVRRALFPLAALAEAEGFALVLVRHWTKGNGTNAKHKGGGSIAYTAAARAVYAVAEDPSDSGFMVLAQVKNNLAPKQESLRYRLVAEGTTCRIQWAGTSPYRADDLTDDADHRSARDDARERLAELLGDGHRHPEQDIRAAMRRDGHSIGTYKRARKDLHVQTAPAGFQGQRMLWLAQPDAGADERAGMADA